MNAISDQNPKTDEHPGLSPVRTKYRSHILRLREEAKALSHGMERESPLTKSRQCETGMHLSDWLRSPGLQPSNLIAAAARLLSLGLHDGHRHLAHAKPSARGRFNTPLRQLSALAPGHSVRSICFAAVDVKRTPGRSPLLNSIPADSKARRSLSTVPV